MLENEKKTSVESYDLHIGRTVIVTVDRPLGSYHPNHKDIYYPINYGYVEGIMAPDGEEQDAYILGVDEAIDTFTGKIIAIVHRNDDVEEKWVVAPEGLESSLSIGIALSTSILSETKSNEMFETLYSLADQALYQVKEKGRDSFMFYEELMGWNKEFN